MCFHGRYCCEFCLWRGNTYPPVSSVRSAKSIIDIDISQFGKRGSESLHLCRLSLDLKRERRTSLYLRL